MRRGGNDLDKRLGPISLSTELLCNDSLKLEPNREFVGLSHVICQVLGRVLNVQKWPKIDMLEIDDGSNSSKPLFFKHATDEDDDSQDESDYFERPTKRAKRDTKYDTATFIDRYVSAMGQVQEVDGDLILVVLRLHPVDDMEEIRCHQFEITAQQLYRTKRHLLLKDQNDAEADADNPFMDFDPLDIIAQHSEHRQNTKEKKQEEKSLDIVVQPSRHRGDEEKEMAKDEEQDVKTRVWKALPNSLATTSGISLQELQTLLSIDIESIQSAIHELFESSQILPMGDDCFCAV